MVYLDKQPQISFLSKQDLFCELINDFQSSLKVTRESLALLVETRKC